VSSLSAEVEELKAICPEVMTSTEGGVTYYLLKGLVLPEGCTPPNVDALLCPSPRDGYPSRLFFAQMISSRKAQNWNSQNVRILDRNWFAYSWRLDAPGQRLAQMLANHMRAL